MTAALTAPMVEAAPDNDSSILAVVMLRGVRFSAWISPAASANPRVQSWCLHALDNGHDYAVLTRADLMALPAN